MPLGNSAEVTLGHDVGQMLDKGRVLLELYHRSIDFCVVAFLVCSDIVKLTQVSKHHDVGINVPAAISPQRSHPHQVCDHRPVVLAMNELRHVRICEGLERGVLKEGERIIDLCSHRATSICHRTFDFGMDSCLGPHLHVQIDLCSRVVHAGGVQRNHLA